MNFVGDKVSVEEFDHQASHTHDRIDNKRKNQTYVYAEGNVYTLKNVSKPAVKNFCRRFYFFLIEKTSTCNAHWHLTKLTWILHN